MRTIFAAMLTMMPLATGALAHEAGHGHAHGPPVFAAGEPGDPRKPSRVVTISMREGEDGRMVFGPDALTVRRGEQVRFVLRNLGRIEHEFVLDSAEGNAAHKAAMAAGPAMEHHDANARQLDAAKGAELVWRFTTPGRFEFACLIPGHYEAGMKGPVTVE